MRALRTVVIATLALVAATSVLAEKGDRWEKLGELRVSDRAERDTLHVGAREGRFEAVQLQVKGRAVQFHDLEIHFENGDVQDVSLRSVIRAGNRSRVIDLDGGERAIDKMVFVYDAQTRRRHRGARVEVFGRH